MKKTIFLFFLLNLSLQIVKAQYGVNDYRAFIIKIPQKSNSLLVKYNESEGFIVIDFTGKVLGKWTSNRKNNYFEKNGIAIEKVDINRLSYLNIKNNLQKIGANYRWGTSFNEGLAIVALPGESLKIIDDVGKDVARIQAYNGKEIELAKSFTEGLAAVQTAEGKWGFINKVGEMVIKPSFSNVSYFNEGYCVVEQNPNDSTLLSGIIDNKGNFVLPLSATYNLAEKVEQGLIKYKIDRYLGIIDTKGNVVVAANEDFFTLGDITKSEYIVFSNGKSLGLIDKKGEIKLRAQYQALQILNNNYLATDLSKQKSYLLNAKMKIEKEFPYLMILPLPNGNFLAFNIGGMILLDKNYEEIGNRTIMDLSFDFILDKYDNAKSDLYNTDWIAAKVLKDFNEGKLFNLSNKSTVLDMVKTLHLDPKDSIDLFPKNRRYQREYLGDYENDYLDGYTNFGYNTKFYGPIISTKKASSGADLEKQIMDSIVMAQRMADSLASLEAAMMPDGLYDDSLNFISSETLQVIESDISEEVSVNYDFVFTDKLKNHLYKERKNTCELCEVKGVEVNGNAKLKSFNINVLLKGKASEKAQKVYEDMKTELTKKGYILVRVLSDNEEKFTIKNVNGIDKGTISLSNNSTVLLHYEF